MIATVPQRTWCRRHRAVLFVLALSACAAAAQTAPVPAPAAATTAARSGIALHPQPWLAGVVQAPQVGAVTLYGPPADTAVRGLALFASGDGGWNLGVIDMARRAAAAGFWVAGFSTPRYFRGLAAQPATQCADAATTLQGLGARLKRQLGLPPALPVVLIGYSSGATLVYAALVQARPDVFDGGLSLGFCPELETRHPFCPGHGDLSAASSRMPPHWPALEKTARVQAPWHILQGDIDQVCAPAYAPEFVAGVPGARAWVLPHVGHGFGYPRNWAPQYQQALDSLLAAAPADTAIAAPRAAAPTAAAAILRGGR